MHDEPERGINIKCVVILMKKFNLNVQLYT